MEISPTNKKSLPVIIVHNSQENGHEYVQADNQEYYEKQGKPK